LGVSVLLVPPSRGRRAEEMLGRARVEAMWGNAPSAEDIRKVDHERLLQNPLLTEPASEDELAMADELLKGSDVRQVAAAFVKMYRAGLPAPEEIEDEPQRFERPGKPRPEKPHHDKPRFEKSRDHKPRDFDNGASPRAPRPPRNDGMPDGVWFRVNVGRERKADPKWLLPEICRQGDVTKKEIGAIRVFDTETLFQVAPGAVEKFSALVTERKKGGIRILPARDQTGESHGRPYGERKAEAAPSAPRQRLVPDHPRTPGDAPPRKPGFPKPGKKFGGKKKFGPKKFNKKKFDKPA
jgi:ATP-dependent RNA helicase DeaD